ncbi:MAG TPA: pyruvate synthase subunit beta [Thermoplasmata archaeon]|nr:pyruvate synthase subunit beta [Thermoplasmata archaeon]
MAARTIKDLYGREEMFVYGHTACPGCGGAIVARAVGLVFGKKFVVYQPANCMLVFGGTYPYLAWKVPYHHVAFENTGACITGIKRALKIKGQGDVYAIGIAGDGGTADIGLQALSGAAERNEDVIYICYDNEAYMNTGIQRSGSTPFGASTTTTPVGKKIKGNESFKKDVPRIMMAHDIPYVATASIGYPNDLTKKLEKAKEMDGKGFRYIQIHAPCPTGWRANPQDTIKLAKLAVETGMWTLYEAEWGEMRINKVPKMTPVKEYLMKQGRFKHMTEEQVEKVQEWVKKKWERDKHYAESTQE